MYSDVRLDQRMSILLAMNTSNELKLHSNWSAQVVNSISESALWNSSKPIKFDHL